MYQLRECQKRAINLLNIIPYEIEIKIYRYLHNLKYKSCLKYIKRNICELCYKHRNDHFNYGSVGVIPYMGYYRTIENCPNTIYTKKSDKKRKYRAKLQARRREKNI